VSTAQDTKAPRRPEDIPVAWFAVLEDARNRGNREREVEAIRQLRRLGVVVSYGQEVTR
jgi:hypothetical protein